ncbi:aconitase family protein, partial [Psychromonas aquatilis]
QQTSKYLELTGRTQEQIDIIEAYAKAQGMWRSESQQKAEYHAQVSLDLEQVVPAIAGPIRPQDRIDLVDAAPGFEDWINQQNELT